MTAIDLYWSNTLSGIEARKKTGVERVGCFYKIKLEISYVIEIMVWQNVISKMFQSRSLDAGVPMVGGIVVSICLAILLRE